MRICMLMLERVVMVGLELKWGGGVNLIGGSAFDNDGD